MSDENEQHPHLGAAAFALAKGVAGGRAKKIFVSYRKADGDHAAVNLDTRLARAFGEDAVFMLVALLSQVGAIKTASILR